MKKKEFDDSLKEVGLSRQDFSEMTGLAYSTIGNWHDEKKPVPEWVDSWIENYRERKKLEELQKILGGER